MAIDMNKPVWQMTAKEFVDLMTSTLNENEKVVVKELPKFLTVPQLAELTGYTVSTIHIKNSKKEIPGCKKLNGRILFDTERILEWINTESVQKLTKEERFVFLEKNFSKRKKKELC